MWKIRSHAGNAALRTAVKVKANPYLILGITYGPVGIYHGLYLTLPKPYGHDLDTHLFIAGGTLLLMFGLLSLYGNQQRLERRLVELERLKS